MKKLNKNKNKNLSIKNEEEKVEEKEKGKPGKTKKELTTKVLGLLQKKGPPSPLK